MEMVKKRGLINGKDTFEVFITADFKLHYLSLFKEVHFRRPGRRPVPRGTNALGSNDVSVDVSAHLAAANAKLNRFLHNFIDKNSTTYTWQEAERTFLERLFRVPPATRQAKASLFYDGTSSVISRYC